LLTNCARSGIVVSCFPYGDAFPSDSPDGLVQSAAFRGPRAFAAAVLRGFRANIAP
jgi:hypothetical protein